jgi:predicted nucleic acid-binding protein
MILVDTSIWVDHLRRADPLMSSLLDEDSVLIHPFVFGEIAMGDLRPRDIILHWLSRLPELLPARDSEVLALVDDAGLFATGIGYVDAHLLAAVRLVPDTQLWTRDSKLLAIAERLSLAARPHDA